MKDKLITLIANSGLQFFTTKVSVGENQKVIPPQIFWQHKDEFHGDGKVRLDIAHQLEDGSVVPKQLLEFDNNGNLLPFDLHAIPQIPQHELIQINKIKDALTLFEGQWLPAPFFKLNLKNNSSVFGPTGWSRMKIENLEITENEEGKVIYSFDLVLVFETSLEKEELSTVLLSEEDTTESNNTFSLCKDENLIFRMFNDESGESWVDDYLLSIAHNGNLPSGDKSLGYLCNYLYLVKYFAEAELVPNVIVFPNDRGKSIPVDLVLDVGNARTCGLLFENNSNKTSYNFTSVRKLELRNLSSPSSVSDDPFSMRLVFSEAKFGDIEIPNYPQIFRWPSVLRLGEEANRLLNQYDISSFVIDEPSNTLSSPKRYLWDKRKAEKPWEFLILKNENQVSHERKHVYLENLTENFTVDGCLTDDNLGVEPKWSKSSLMVFVYIEILSQAISQINSHGFRKENNEFIGKPRALRKIIITCPSGMAQKEQVELRSSAKIALDALEKYYKNVYNGSDESTEEDLSGFSFDLNELENEILSQEAIENDTILSNIEVIPSHKDIERPLSNLESRNDWIFDEASASQIIFVYGEVIKKYKSNFRKYFEIYGRPRMVNNQLTPSLTVTSIDIGGGTTDLMITNYTYDDSQQKAVFKPNPLFWETYNIAGDDLLKEIIHQILIDGASDKESQNQSNKGIIRNYASRIGCTDISDKILHFFGEHANYKGASHIVYRKNFITQVLVPIGLKLLNYAASGNSSTKYFSFEEIFDNNPPNSELIEYINSHFGDGFNFKEIKWEASLERINNVIHYIFNDLFKQLASLSFAFNTDILLLAGKPTSISEFRNILLKELPITPDRLISLSNYKIGLWYPYTNKKGYLVDPKTTVAVGGMIYALAGKLKQLKGLTLDTELLKKKLISTADYIGEIDSSNYRLNKILLDPKKDYCELKVEEFPLTIGFKQLPPVNYHSRPLFQLDFNYDFVKNMVRDRNPAVSESQFNVLVSNEVSRFKNKAPYHIQFSRDLSISKEKINIDSIENRDGNQESNQLLVLNLMTIQNENGYWLDTGEFKILSHED